MSIMNALITVPLRLFRLLIDFVTDLIYGWIYEGDRTAGPKVPPVRDVLLLDPAHVLADKIRTKRVTSVQILDVYFKRISEVNGAINCMVDQR